MPLLKPFRRGARHCLVALYYLAVVVLEMAGRIFRRLGWLASAGPQAQPYAPGVSVIVPERANPELLEQTLAAAQASLGRLSEPSEIIVVVNGWPRENYRNVEARFPQVRFIHRDEPLGFSRAVELGLKQTRFDWVYLLNNDMLLEPAAIEEAMRWRAPHVFSVASQIFFRDPARRREETGWTDFDVYDGWVTIFDVPPDENAMVRGNFYAGGGASLFRKSLLLRFVDASHPYDPAYWEDVEWGALAWRCGFESLFCPASRAWHTHRATVSKFYTPEQIDRLFRRNNFRFQMRNMCGPRLNRDLFRWLRKADPESLLMLMQPSEIKATLAARWRRFKYPLPETILAGRRARFYPRPPEQSDARPLVVAVSPFAVFPPAHGGAVRIHRLLAALTTGYRVILLSDERELYGARSLPYMEGLESVHLVCRKAMPAALKDDRIARIRAHSHTALRAELARLLAMHRPSAVQLEYVELAKLVELRESLRFPCSWVLTLHDVLLSEDGTQTPADRYERALIDQFDVVVACSPEDRALLTGNAALVPNGVDCRSGEYTPSRGARRIGFLGPFRYAPNLAGITRFCEIVFPELRRRVPGVELWILGGHGAEAIAASRPELRQNGIRIFESVEDVSPCLRQCALTVNPLSGCRGSSLKVLDSLARGRVCVTTANGARGYLDAGIEGLVICPGVEDFVEPLVRLLTDEDHRVALEQRSMAQVQKFDWSNSAAQLLRLYEPLLGNPQITQISKSKADYAD